MSFPVSNNKSIDLLSIASSPTGDHRRDVALAAGRHGKSSF